MRVTFSVFLGHVLGLLQPLPAQRLQDVLRFRVVLHGGEDVLSGE